MKIRLPCEHQLVFSSISGACGYVERRSCRKVFVYTEFMDSTYVASFSFETLENGIIGRVGKPGSFPGLLIVLISVAHALWTG